MSALIGNLNIECVIDDVNPSGPYRDMTDIEVLQDKIFNCQRDIYKFQQFIRFKRNSKDTWLNLIASNEGMIKECQIRIALLGG